MKETETDTVHIVCLANSRKLDGRCVAGKDPESGRWYRPVSDRPGGSVSEYERQYPDGRDPKLLDVIDVPVIRHVPNLYQPENWLIDPVFYWESAGEFDYRDLRKIADAPAELWQNGYSTVVGSNDRVPEALAENGPSSLYLIGVEDLVVRVFKPGEAYGDSKRKVRGAFTHRAVAYDMTVTDPVIERRFLAGSDGEFTVGESFLAVSLAEPHQGFAYKLIAAVIEAR